MAAEKRIFFYKCLSTVLSRERFNERLLSNFVG